MNYGTILSDLRVDVLEAVSKAHKEFFGTPSYYTEAFTNVHRAFDAFCDELSIDPALRGQFREKLTDHCTRYPNWNCAGLEYLFFRLPDAFNVRGKWTSEKA